MQQALEPSSRLTEPMETTPSSTRVWMNRLLILGLLLRIVVFFLASPFNADNHFEVIECIARTHTLPATNVLEQSHHPPLYHAAMAVLYAAWPGEAAGATRLIHFVSCILSCATLVLIRKLINHELIVALAPSNAVRLVVFALAATHAQFIIFGSYISNDALSQLIGTIQFAAVLAYIQSPSVRRVMILAALVAVGLLTKGTFLLTGAALAIIVARTEWRRAGLREAAKITLLFCAVWSVLGCFKYVDNIVRVGRPLAYILDLQMKPSYPVAMWHGPSTIFDLNVVELIRNPVIRPAHPMSYAIVTYATFWYAHFGDASFRGNVSGYESVGRMTYAVAIVPTVVFLVGVSLSLGTFVRWLRKSEVATDAVWTVVVASLAMLAANFVIFFGAGVKFDRWDSFQSRLLFPSAMPLMVLLMVGLRQIGRVRGLSAFVLACCWATAACGVLYLLVEFALVLRWLDVDQSLLFEIHAK